MQALRFTFWYTVVMALIIAVILLKLFGLSVEKAFSVTCTGQPGDQDMPAIVLTDTEGAGAPAFLPEDALAARLEAGVATLAEGTGPLVLWVHGFRTDVDAARCLAGLLQDALRDANGEAAPRVVTFAWPSDFGNRHFARAQDNAQIAAGHLADLLDRIDRQRVTLVAHSLGAQVALEALSMPAPQAQKPLAHLVLVQGAVPHASIRSWQGERKVTLPRFGTTTARDLDPVPIGPGTGCYVAALAKARRVTITSTTRDSVLSGAFAASTNIHQRCFGPMILGNSVNMHLMPGSLALGLPFTDPPNDCIPYTLPGRITDDDTRIAPRNSGPIDGSLPPLPDAPVVMSDEGRVCTSVTFTLPRDDIDFLDLDAHRSWLMIGNWHNPLARRKLRQVIAERLPAD